MASLLCAGALGTLVSQWLLQQPLRHLALISRSGAFTADSAEALLPPHQGAAVTLSKADAGFATDVEAVLARAVPAVTGVMHAGGVLADATVANQTLAGIRQVRRALQAPCPASAVNSASLSALTNASVLQTLFTW